MNLIRLCILMLMVTSLLGCERRADETPARSDEMPENSAQADEPTRPPEGEPSVPETDERALWTVESIGPVRIDMPDAKVADAVGPPKTKSDPQVEGATGDYVTTWNYDGVEIGFRGESDQGPWVSSFVRVEAPSDWKTERGIGVGSSREDVERVYAGEINGAEGEGGGPEQVVVGTNYGGILFDFSDGAVSRIFVGAAAE